MPSALPTRPASPIGHAGGGSPTSGEPLRLGCVSYLNTLPLIEGLGAQGGVELVPAPPADLIEMLTASRGHPSRVDAALVSLIDFQRSQEPLTLMPVGGIISPGATHTVRLFSRGPVERIQTLWCDSESHTSVVLARVILGERFGARPEVRSVRWEGAADGCEAVLLIGDKVASSAPARDDFPHQLDLGEAWRQMTGLPFVYACWMCRTSDEASKRVARAAGLLDRARRHNATRLGWIASARAGAHRWAVDEARRYLGDLLSFEIDGSAREAIERFFNLACEHEMIAERRATRWLGDRSA